MIDFVLKIPNNVHVPRGSIMDNVEILEYSQNNFAGNSKIQILFPIKTVYKTIKLEEKEFIIIGDLIAPPGTGTADLLKTNTKNNIENFPGFFYLIEMRQDQIDIFTSLFNILPIFYCSGHKYIFISSKAHLIKEISGIKPALNKRFILEQKLFNYSFLNETIYKEIKTVPANSYIEYKAGNINIINHTNIEDFFTTEPMSWKKAVDEVIDLFLHRVQDYFPKERFFISFTGGFDGRTLVACAKKYQKNFKTFSFGAADNIDLTLPREQAKDLGVDFEPIYLDDEYIQNNFLDDGKELMTQVDGNSNFLQVHFLYAARYLSEHTESILNGMFGSELFRALHVSGQVTSKGVVDFFRYDEDNDWIAKLKNAASLKYLNLSNFRTEFDELIADLQLYKKKRSKDLSRNHFFYKFIFEEAFRKFFGTQIISQLPYVKVRSPFFDFKFIKKMLRTELCGANNEFFTHNPFRRYKGQLFYAKIIDRGFKPLLRLRTDKGYRPVDLISLPGKLNIARVYFSKRIKRKFSPPELDNLAIVSGINKNLDFFRSIKVNDAFFNSVLVSRLFENHAWLLDRDKFIETLSTNYFIDRVFV